MIQNLVLRLSKSFPKIFSFNYSNGGAPVLAHKVKKAFWCVVGGGILSFPFAILNAQEKQSPEIVFAECNFAQAIAPYRPEDFKEILQNAKLPLSLVSSLSPAKIIPLRRDPVGNLLHTLVYRTEKIEVYFPEYPRFPYHLAIAVPRKIQGIAEMSLEENRALYTTIKKIAEVYRKVGIDGFVIAQYEAPQEGHQERCVVELMPHDLRFPDRRCDMHKAYANSWMLFRGENLTPFPDRFSAKEREEQAAFLQKELQQPQSPLHEEDIRVTYPWAYRSSHEKEAKQYLQRHLLEVLENRGAQIRYVPLIPSVAPQEAQVKEIPECVFCNPNTLEKQKIVEWKGIYILYNLRKGPKEGTNFLILPKEHTPKVYGFTPQQIDSIFEVKQALIRVLRRLHPTHEVVIYTQDAASVGQTVAHSHDQVVSIDPKTIALTWTVQSLFYGTKFFPMVTEEETRRIVQALGPALEQELRNKQPKEQERFEELEVNGPLHLGSLQRFHQPASSR